MKTVSFFWAYLKNIVDSILKTYNEFNNFTLLKKTTVIALSFIISLLSIIALFNFVDIPMKYNEFIVGSSTWRAEGKAVDLLAGPLFIFVFILSFGFISFILEKIKIKAFNNYKIIFKENSLIIKSVICLLILGISLFYISKNKLYENDLIVDISVVSSIANDYQIFYDTGSGFNERESVRNTVKNHGQFIIPSSKISRLRIDPGSKPGLVVIDKISIASGNSIIHFSGDELRQNFAPVHHISSFEIIEDKLNIVSMGNDPHFIYTGEYFPHSFNYQKIGAVFFALFVMLILIIFHAKIKILFLIIYLNFLKDYKYWLVPFIIISVELYLKRNLSTILLLPSFFAFFLGILHLAYSKYRRKIVQAEFVNIIAIVSLLLMIFPFSVFSFFKFFNIYFVNEISFFLWAMIIAIFSILSVTVYYKQINQRLNKLILFAQLSLPLLFLNIIPKSLNTNFGELRYNYSWILYLLVFSLVAFSLYEILKRYFKSKTKMIKSLLDIMKLISPVALFALLIVLKFSLTAIPSVSTDDYHFGEHLIGAWSYFQGVVPYVDYLPAHGLFVNDFAAFLNFILFGGLAGSFNQSRIIASIIIGLIAFLSLNHYLKNIIVTFLIFLISPWLFNWIVLVPFLCLWLDEKLLNKPQNWISIFILTSPLLVLMVPPQGSVLVATFIIIFCFNVYRVIKFKRLDLYKPIVLASMILVPLYCSRHF